MTFSFPIRNVTPDKYFKSHMNPKGKVYRVDESINNIPSLVAALLKGKKHERIVITFATLARANYLWCNKGFDSYSVDLPAFIGYEDVIQFAKDNGCTTIIEFHNHPNENPSRYDCSHESEQDRKSAAKFAAKCKEHDLNFLAFVCERGGFRQYHSFISDAYLPTELFEIEIRKENGSSPETNYRLHRQNRRRRIP